VLADAPGALQHGHLQQQRPWPDQNRQPARRAGGALGSVAAQWADDFWLSARTA
jgi:hypothetical protein